MSGTISSNGGPPVAPAQRSGQPGVNVPIGSLITPGGDQGPAGVQGAAGPTKVSTDAGNRATLGSDSYVYVPPYPYADATQGGLLRQVSGKSSDFVDGTNSTQDLAAATRNNIWYVRQRSFNGVGNSNFEVDARNASTATVAPTGNVWLCDRWLWGQSSSVTGRVTLQQAPASGYGVAIPGVNYIISTKYASVKLTTGQAALAPGDVIYLMQTIEGPRFRELAADVTSLSLLVNCDVAFNFTVALRDNASGYSLVIPCSVPAAAWTLIQLPNQPIWPSAGTFSSNPGTVGYTLTICLASGATFTAPGANTWSAGNFLSAAGADNFLDFALNTVFRVAAVQHEPGPNCSYLMDLDFGLNRMGCQRYFQKTYQYGTKPGTVTGLGMRAFMTPGANANAWGPGTFMQTMAKAPLMTLYNYNSGAANSVRDGAGVDHAGASVANIGDNGFPYFSFTTATTAAMAVYFHYIADTGW